jgi:hypothetical protein
VDDVRDGAESEYDSYLGASRVLSIEEDLPWCRGMLLILSKPRTDGGGPSSRADERGARSTIMLVGRALRSTLPARGRRHAGSVSRYMLAGSVYEYPSSPRSVSRAGALTVVLLPW